ncbi:hypothetical protein ILYODFUR_009096 [Ilyodon furcidens]|uniref:Uncharacterized protein n=1 Tax=Ilyodon furcidens TaxID=33524 RepID=A0ABV0TUG3_9TELE
MYGTYSNAAVPLPHMLLITFNIHQLNTALLNLLLCCVTHHIRKICTIIFPSLNCHLNVLEGFECSNDPSSYVVRGLNDPGRVSHGKQALCDGSDKERFKTPS